jgi:hypothetical protein
MSRKIEMIGRRFGRWTVIECAGKVGKASALAYRCKCDCGTVKVVNGNKLRIGESMSCGCLKLEIHRKHCETGTRLYHIWENMKQRCTNPANTNFRNYGGRGIAICGEWLESFEVFREWAMANGYNDTLTIDRVDVNGNYCPENCRWATREIQSCNKRQAHIIAINGEKKSVTEWAKEKGIAPSTIFARIKYGWNESELLNPVQKRCKP